MDTCSATSTLKAHLATVCRSGICNGEDGFWGEKIKGSLKNCTWANKVGKSSSLGKDGRKFKPGVAYSVLTRENSQETATVQSPRIERRRANPKNVAAIILGGGAGTQLFPLTTRAATPAVPLGGCYRLIDIPMSNCINSGINKIFVLTQFNSASLNRHISRTYTGNGINFGDGCVEVLAATQTAGEMGKQWFQGTADAVRQFLWLFEDAKVKDIEHIVILSGDHLYRMDYMDFVQNHLDRNADLTLSCVPVGDSRASNFGLVKIDSSGQITQFSEKPKDADKKAMQIDGKLIGLSPNDAAKSPYLASMGVYAFKKEILLKLLRWRYPTSNDFGSEIIPSSVREQNVQAYIFRDYWEDIGTIKSFYDANLALTDEMNRAAPYILDLWPKHSYCNHGWEIRYPDDAHNFFFPCFWSNFIHFNYSSSPRFEFYDPKTPFYTSPSFLPPTKIDNSKIKDAIISHGCFLRESIVEHSIVGERSRLDTGVELKDTLMMGADYYQTESEIASLLAQGRVPVGIGRDTKIRNCIIDKNARIGKNVMILNKDGVEETDGGEKGFYIRSGITIILEKATIYDGMVI